MLPQLYIRSFSEKNLLKELDVLTPQRNLPILRGQRCSRLIRNRVLSHPQRVLKERLVSCILPLAMALFHGHDHWGPHSEVAALCSPQSGAPEANQLPFIELREQLLHLHFHISVFGHLSVQSPVLTNKVGEESHLGLN